MKNKYQVQSIPKELTHAWLLRRHYAKRLPSISYAFGIYDTSGTLKGVCTYGSPATRSIQVGIAGEENASLVIELNRVVLDTNEPNLASFFISRTLDLLPKPSIIVSYSDTSMSHHGYIYQATNFLYTGLSSPHIDWVLEGDVDRHSRHRINELTIEQAKALYGDKFKAVERSRKHRYIYITADKPSKKRLLAQLLYKQLPYPKGDNKQYDSGSIDYNQLPFLFEINGSLVSAVD